MSPAAVEVLNCAIVETSALPDVNAKLLQAGFSPKSSTPKEFEALTQSEYKRLGDIARQAHMSAE